MPFRGAGVLSYLFGALNNNSDYPTAITPFSLGENRVLKNDLIARSITIPVGSRLDTGANRVFVADKITVQGSLFTISSGGGPGSSSLTLSSPITTPAGWPLLLRSNDGHLLYVYVSGGAALSNTTTVPLQYSIPSLGITYTTLIYSGFLSCNGFSTTGQYAGADFTGSLGFCPGGGSGSIASTSTATAGAAGSCLSFYDMNNNVYVASGGGVGGYGGYNEDGPGTQGAAGGGIVTVGPSSGSPSYISNPDSLYSLLTGYVLGAAGGSRTGLVNLGVGGGGGGGDSYGTTNNGGGGGGAGGPLFLLAGEVDTSTGGIIESRGGNGADGGSGAGGGGGGGGSVKVIYGILNQGNGVIESFGGRGGTGTGTYANGQNGAGGTVTLNPLS